MGLFGKDEPEPANVLDKPLTCQVCGSSQQSKECQ